VQRVLSLVQTDEEFVRKADASPSDRRQVLDGVITYSPSLAIVLENKPSHKHIWEAQLDVSITGDAKLDPRVACVTWKEIITAWGGLLEAHHLAPAEAVLLGDFLDYVEEHFPRLRPYSKVALCGTDTERLHRRCKMILQAIAGEPRVEKHLGWGWYIRLAEDLCAAQIGLFPLRTADGLNLVLEIDPGDTISQARVLYKSVKLEDILSLTSRKWMVEPNLHLMHMTRGLLQTSCKLAVEEYWAFWPEHPDWLRKWKRAEFESAFNGFVAERLAAETDRPAFEKHLTNTRRETFSLCPGLRLRWRCPVEEAALLDQRGTLQDTIRHELEAAAAALHLTRPW
jgi:hypothetical protein